jgi:hypothetical protein
MKLSLDTLEDLLLEGEIEKVEDDTLVLSEEFTTKTSKKEECKKAAREKDHKTTYEAIL